jgi:endogenous inhibitor of DNA gyrase (YacG/DUF329 family)
LLELSRREKFYPFCSKRCKMIDLGKWIDGDYKIVSELKKEDSEDIDEDTVGKSKNSGQSKDDNE